MTIIFYAIWLINNNIKTTNSHDNSIYYFENDRKIPDKKNWNLRILYWRVRLEFWWSLFKFF